MTYVQRHIVAKCAMGAIEGEFWQKCSTEGTYIMGPLRCALSF